MSHSTRESVRALRAVAAGQGGYFTAKQAIEAGYGYPHFHYHVAAGNFEHVDHGLYRLVDILRDAHDELVRMSLWSRDRGDMTQAVVSHESALALHELSDLLPSRIHVTVPPGFRKPRPKGCVLHKATLAAADIEEREGFQVTSPFRTILDVTRGGISQEQLDKSVSEALDRGLVRRSKLVQASKQSPKLNRLRLALDWSEKNGI